MKGETQERHSSGLDWLNRLQFDLFVGEQCDERASNSNPTKHFSQIFGFCLLHEMHESIKQPTQVLLVGFKTKLDLHSEHLAWLPDSHLTHPTTEQS